MKDALAESRSIFEKLMNEKQKKSIVAFLNEVEEKENKYETSIIWLMDQGIGGIGGYCLPVNPSKNPFPDRKSVV